MDATKYLVKNMMQSVTKKIEIEILYGQMGYGVVASATTTVVVITAAEWASGIWAGAENMPIEIRNAAGSVSRGTFSIVSVDTEARSLTLSADAAAAGVIATDIVWHSGAFGKEMAGVHKILSQASGSLFGISVTSSSLWKGSVYSAGSAALSFTKVNNAVARAVDKGCDSKLSLIVNTKTWSNLNNDLAALRHYDQSYKPADGEIGNEKLVYHSQNGVIEIVPSIFCKEGYAYLLEVDSFTRIGSSDVTFKTPGMGDDFFRQLDNAAGYELRLYTDQALFCNAPAHNVLISGIVNQA